MGVDIIPVFNPPKEEIGCDRCNGDEPIYYDNNENCMFIDNKGEMFVVVKGKVKRTKVKFCPQLW